MGVREDFDQALRSGDFIKAARAWATGNLDRDAGVEGFETKLAASLEEHRYVAGEVLSLAGGEYEYLGLNGKYGARLAYTPADGSLDNITYIRDQDELLAHLEKIGAPLAEVETVVGFFAISERQAMQQGQQNEVAPSMPSAAEQSVRDTAANTPANDPVAASTQQKAAPSWELEPMEQRDVRPAAVVDFEQRVRATDWFYDPVDETDAAAIAVRQERDQIRADLKALLQEYPAEAAEVWRAHAPELLQADLAGALSTMQAEAEAHVHAGEEADAIAPAEKGNKEAPEQSEDAIQPVALGKAGSTSKQGVDAISPANGSMPDTISATKPKGAVEVGDAEQGDRATGSSPKTLLNGRFILRNEGQYFRVADGVESTRVALVDEATKIRFVDKQMDTFQAAIELAKDKQWEAILVTGSEKFRAEAWHHARMVGLEVVGYEPNEKDLATLKAAQEGKSKIETAKASPAAAAAVVVDDNKAKSLQAANEYALGHGFGVSGAKVLDGRHVGKVIHETDKHLVQDVGRKVAVVHDKDNFDRQALRAALEAGKPLKVQYKNGRAAIETSKERAQERGR